MELQLNENPLIKKWLRLKKSRNTKYDYLIRISKFLEHFDMTPEELLELSPKEARELCLVYQNENRNLSNNTILGRQTAVASFMDYYDKTIKWKRNTKVKPRPDVSSHVFSNGDLSRMFEVGSTRDKCMLSLACSLGWEISAFVDFKKEILHRLLERQAETKEDFVYFREIREKTGEPRLAILNPLSIKWSRKWLQEAEHMTLRERDPIKETFDSKRRVSDIFDLTGKGILNRIKVLARRAGIKTTGNVRFHNIRKWCMSGLSRSGFNEWQTKYVLGKSIPLADSTYLQTLELEVRERYPKAFEEYLNLETSVPRKAVTSLSKELEESKEKNQELRNRVETLEKRMHRLFAVGDEWKTIDTEFLLQLKANQKDLEENQKALKAALLRLDPKKEKD